MTHPPLNSLYQQLILEHYRKPKNQGELEDCSVEIHLNNPVCGDDIRLQLKIEGETITDVKFEGQGCSISQASVSMMTARLKNKPVTEARALFARFTEMMHGDDDAAKDKTLGDLRALQGVSKFPVRIKCALLGFDALKQLLDAHSAPSLEEEKAAI
jgi:nitrogen fixation protein NifU and related proteins